MERRKKQLIPEEFKSLKEAGEFWDTHSAADYWDEMEDVPCDVDIQSWRFSVILDEPVYDAVKQAADEQDIPPGAFVNQFLRRRLMHTTDQQDRWARPASCGRKLARVCGRGP